MFDTTDTEKLSKVATGPNGIQSLHRAVAILQAVAHAREGIGLADLSKEVGLHTSTAFHLAKTLVTLGLLRQERDSKRYRIGTRLFSLASNALDERELRDIALPVLTELSENTGESSNVAVRAGRDVFIIAFCDAPGSIKLAVRVGAARPPHATAIGKALMSSFSPSELDSFVSSLTLTSVTPNTITDADVLKAQVAEVRRTGIALDDGEFSAELRCLASPVFDFRGEMVATVGISVPMWRMGLARVSAVTGTVIDAANKLSGLLGYSKEASELKGTGRYRGRHSSASE